MFFVQPQISKPTANIIIIIIDRFYIVLFSAIGLTLQLKPLIQTLRAQKLCESQGGCPGNPIPNSPDYLCGRKARFEEEEEAYRHSL